MESDYGYHIILRQDPADAPALREEWQAQKMDGVLEQWVEEAQIETTQTYDDLTTADFYEKLTAYIAAHQMEVAGFSREITMIDYGLTNDLQKFVTEISIPVRMQ